MDLAVQNYALALRNHIADPIMVALVQLSSLWVLVPTTMAVLLWLIGAGRKTAAVHWLIAMGGGVALEMRHALAQRDALS